MDNKMANDELDVEIVTDKKYFIGETINIFFRFSKKSLKPKYSDWIGLYKRSSNRNLEEFVTVVTDLTIRSPTKISLNPVTIYAFQLKNIDCSLEYEFIFGNKHHEICGISSPVRFIHKNDCCHCYPTVPNTNQFNDSVSQEVVNSLFARISLIDSQLSDFKTQSNEIMSINKRLMVQLNECEEMIQKNNDLLDDLFYTDEPVTKDGYRWMQSCSDNDLKISLIASQELELQDLSNQNRGLKKVLEKSNENVLEDNVSLENMDPNIISDSVVSIETCLIPEPSIASIVFIDSDEDDMF